MFGSWGNKLKSYLVGKRFPLGHGAVLSFPDRPYLEWVYTNCFEEKIIRNNPRDYMEASQNMYKAMVRYRAGNANQEVGDLPEADKKILEEMIRGVRDDEGEDRHKHWLKAIEEGKFSFGAEKINYIAKGEGSWKQQALGTTKETENKDEKFEYQPSFLTSDWKMFHDALQAHRFNITNLILPKYGICAA